MATRPLPLDNRLSIAAQLVVRSRLFFDIWWYYEGAETRPQIIDTLRKYNEFFRFEPHAHFVSFVVHMAALIEHRRDTINLRQLVLEVAGFDNTPDSERCALTDHLPRIETTGRKIIILRSNLFGHRSAKQTYDDVFSLASITPNEIAEFSDETLMLVNRLLSIRQLPTMIFTPHPKQDLASMISVLGGID